jgi:diguanylate cyclase (GGDEF)-like protein/PAS domain S-box-containing protein
MLSIFNSRLIFALVLSTVLIMSIFGSVRFYLLKQSFEKSLDSQVEQTAHRITSVVKPSIWTLYSKSVERSFSEEFASGVIDSELAGEYIVGVVVYGQFGHVYMGKWKDERGNVIPYQENQRQQILSYAGLLRSYPLRFETMTLGKVELFVDTTELEKELTRALIVEIVQIGIISLFFVLFLFYVIKRTLFEPMRKLELAHKTFESMSEAIVFADDRGFIYQSNTAFQHMVALSDENVKGKNIRTFFPEILGEMPLLFEKNKSKLPWQGEAVFYVDGKQKSPVWLTISIVTDPSSHHSELVFVFQDISERKLAEEALQEKEERLSLAALHNGVGIWDLNPQTEELIWDDSQFALFNINKDDFSGAYDAWTSCLHPDDKGKAEQELNDALLGGQPFNTDFRVIWPNGEIRNIKGVAKIFRDDSGKPLRMLGINADITEQKEAEEKLKLAASVFTHAREGIMITDAEGTIIDVNETYTSMTGFSREEAIGQKPSIHKSGRHEPEFYAEMWQAIEQKGYWNGEIWNRRKNGEIYPELKTISAVRNERDETSHYVAVFTDITLIKEHQHQLEHIAHYDLLTGLPNRSLLSDRLSQAMLHCDRTHKSIAVAFVDLDSFKEVNDVHGHDVGDDLLIAISHRMKEALREGDTLARFGGDEFIVVLTDLEEPKDYLPVLDRLLSAASESITLEGRELRVTASIGVTVYPKDAADAEQLMRHADQAMYVAKNIGKNRYHMFDTDEDDAVKVQRENRDDIRLALARKEFVLHYQPKVNMLTGEVIGAEALIRWQHPQRGLLSPGLFLPIIENEDVSIDLGEWVIEDALQQLAKWKKEAINLPISVNVSAYQLQQMNFTDRLSELLIAHPDVDPNSLELEVLETSAINDVGYISAIMQKCMKLGVNFALDDFGTGYSSLTYLRRLPARRIKIDQTFVRDMLDDADDCAIVEGVVGLAKSFKREVIAEGVETIEHGTVLLQLGCELAQGYGIARPMPANEVLEWMESWEPDQAWKS